LPVDRRVFFVLLMMQLKAAQLKQKTPANLPGFLFLERSNP
jgi:hypothetical protein